MKPLQTLVLYCIIYFCLGSILRQYAQSQYKTLGPGSCGSDQAKCHVSEHKNMVRQHKNSIDKLLGPDNIEDARKIARIYGLTEETMIKGNAKCMECHGTVITGKETAEVEDGVSCESCHGPGSAYKDPHSEKGAYQKALQLGLKDLKKLDVRAAMCVKCHLTTDQKLLAGRHPTGLKFKYATNMTDVSLHWKRPVSDLDKTKKYFDDAIASRGPLPKDIPLPPDVAKKMEEKETQSEVGISTVSIPRKTQPPKTPIAAIPITAPFSLGPIDLEPFPTITDSASIDQILLIIKKRLELLYQKTNVSSKK